MLYRRYRKISRYIFSVCLATKYRSPLDKYQVQLCPDGTESDGQEADSFLFFCSFVLSDILNRGTTIPMGMGQWRDTDYLTDGLDYVHTTICFIQYYTYKKMFRHIFRLPFKLRFFFTRFVFSFLFFFWCLQTTLWDNSEFGAFFLF